MTIGWDFSSIDVSPRTCAVKKAAPEDLKALIEKVDCFIFDCDGGRWCFFHCVVDMLVCYERGISR